MNFVYHMIVMISITTIVCTGYNMVFGKGKILFFGQEAASLIIVYALWVFFMQKGLSFIAAIALAVLFAGIVAVVFAWLSLRLKEDAFGVMSIAVHLMVLAVVLNWQSVTRGALGIPRIPRPEILQSLGMYALLCATVAVVWLLFLWRIDKSRIGRALSALSEHHWYAASIGISRAQMYMITFIIATTASLLSAILYPPYIHLLTPQDYGFPAMIVFVMYVIAGNPGSLWGAVTATASLMILKEALRFLVKSPGLTGPLELIVFGFVLFAAVWWRRDTLFPQRRSV